LDPNGAALLTYKWVIKYNGKDETAALASSFVFDKAKDVYNWGNDSYATATFAPPKTFGSTTITTVGDGAVFTIEVTVTDPTGNTATQSVDLKVGTVVTYPGTITIQKPAMFKRR
jgi:hypothetical protein